MGGSMKSWGLLPLPGGAIPVNPSRISTLNHSLSLFSNSFKFARKYTNQKSKREGVIANEIKV